MHRHANLNGPYQTVAVCSTQFGCDGHFARAKNNRSYDYSRDQAFQPCRQLYVLFYCFHYLFRLAFTSDKETGTALLPNPLRM